MVAASVAAVILIIVMVSKSETDFLALATAAVESHAHAPLLVDVLAVVVAHELHHLVVAQTSIGQRVDDRLLQDDRIVDGDLVVKDVRRYQPQSFGDAHLIAVWNVLIAGHGFLDSYCVDNKRLSVPAPHRMAVVAG